jgi:curli biogenesis system outer membrane secretion channel CsgG
MRATDIPLRAALVLTFFCAALSGCAATRPHAGTPVTSSFGPFDLKTFVQLETLAVFTFTDAPRAPGSGQAVTNVLTTLLEPMGFTVIGQIKLDSIAWRELGLRDDDWDPRNMLAVAKQAKAQAMVLGEVGQWESVRQKGPVVWVPLSPGVTRVPQKEWDEATVAVALKIVDVRTGETLFSGQGAFAEPTTEHPKLAVEQILSEVLARCFQHIAPTRTGLLGYKAAMQDLDGKRVPVVTEVVPDSPVQRAGLHVGDVILACQDTAGQVRWQTIWQHANACGAEAGQTRSLQVARENERVTIRATALARSAFVSTPAGGRVMRDLFSPL